MKSFLTICIVLVCYNGIAQYHLPEGAHRILFLGNSITYAGGYITDIEAYYVTHYPQRNYEFINMGLPSETVSGLSEPGHAEGKFPRPDLHERIDRVLALTHPDVVFICYGMNDGIYLPFETGRFQKFVEGLTDIHSRVAKTGATIIHLTPPYYDELKGKNKGYEAALDQYSNWVVKQRRRAGWNVIDIHDPMKQFTLAHRKVDSAFHVAAFALAEDGVHPGPAGHWIMARQILVSLGEKTVARSASIEDAIATIRNGEAMLQLVAKRQALMKDAWLTAAGHRRPFMNKGLPLNEAQEQGTEIAHQIRALQQ